MVVVAVVWGLLGYKVVANYFGGEPELPPTAVEQGFTEFVIDFKKDTFQLQTVSVDPFLKKAYTPRRVVKTQKTSSGTKKAVIPAQPILWPAIQYLGFVKSNDRKNKLAMIKVNGALHRTREGQMIGELKLLKAYNDSIKVSLNKEVKVIKN